MKPIPVQNRAFTLVELLAAITIFSILFGILLYVVGETSRTVSGVRSKASAFQAGRNAFESLTRNLSQATLNTYLDYYDASGAPRSQANARTFQPAAYERTSELHFISGRATDLIPAAAHAVMPVQGQATFFQSPLGFTSDTSTLKSHLRNALNLKGFYICYRDGATDLPSFMQSGKTLPRFTLMEIFQPTENLLVYNYWPKQSATPPNWPLGWFQTFLQPTSAKAYRRPLAENVIALVLWPRRENLTAGSGNLRSLARPNYRYDSKEFDTNPSVADDIARTSRNQLPPLIDVTMVVMDEASGLRLAGKYHATSPDLTKLPFTPGLFESLGSDAATSAQLAKLNADLESLKTKLHDENVNYRIFSTSVTIRQAKWSE